LLYYKVRHTYIIEVDKWILHKIESFPSIFLLLLGTYQFHENYIYGDIIL